MRLFSNDIKTEHSFIVNNFFKLFRTQMFHFTFLDAFFAICFPFFDNFVMLLKFIKPMLIYVTIYQIIYIRIAFPRYIEFNDMIRIFKR